MNNNTITKNNTVNGKQVIINPIIKTQPKLQFQNFILHDNLNIRKIGAKKFFIM